MSSNWIFEFKEERERDIVCTVVQFPEKKKKKKKKKKRRRL